MISKAHQIKADGVEQESDVDPEVIIVSPEAGRAMFDEAALTIMGMSGDEFIERWEAGEFDEIADKAGHRHIMHLALLIPFARQES
jgi:hypothetical protein